MSNNLRRRNFIMQAFDPLYQNVINTAIVKGYGLPSPTTQKKDNEFVKGLRADGLLLTITEFLYVFSTDGSPEFSRLNWINPDQFECSLLGSPTFTTNAGWKGGVATGAALNTNYSSNLDLQLASQNNFSFGTWLLENTTSGFKFDIGARNNNLNRLSYILAKIGTDTFFQRSFLNDLGVNGFTEERTLNSSGFKSTSRINNIRKQYNNGQEDDSRTLSSSIPPDEEFYILALNQGGSVTGESDRTSRFAYAGLGNVNQSQLYNRVLTRLS